MDDSCIQVHGVRGAWVRVADIRAGGDCESYVELGDSGGMVRSLYLYCLRTASVTGGNCDLFVTMSINTLIANWFWLYVPTTNILLNRPEHLCSHLEIHKW